MQLCPGFQHQYHEYWQYCPTTVKVVRFQRWADAYDLYKQKKMDAKIMLLMFRCVSAAVQAATCHFVSGKFTAYWYRTAMKAIFNYD
jgi:hypothetical protein